MYFDIKLKSGKVVGICIGATANTVLYPDTTFVFTEARINNEGNKYTFINEKQVTLIVNEKGEYRTITKDYLPAHLIFKFE